MPAVASDRTLSPAGILLTRGLLYLVLAAIGTGALWASLSRLDVVVSAEGRLAPKSGPIRLSATSAGVIAEVMVRVGDHVGAGQPILRIDAFREDADASRTRHGLDRARAETERYRESAGRLREALVASREALGRDQRALALLADEVATLRTLANQGLASRLALQEKEREVAQSQAAIARLQGELLRSEEEIQRNERLRQQAESQALSSEADLRQSTEAVRRTLLTAPQAGIVTLLAASRPGFSLQAQEVAAALMPDGEPLYAEIKIPNTAMRRIRPGLAARLKFRAYPYQDYGILAGTLEEVEPDADDTGAYRAWVRLGGASLDGPHGPEPLRPGLLLWSEIVVDRRSVVSVVLDPFRRLRGGLTVSD
jgi:HlyD family secretion protein